MSKKTVHIVILLVFFLLFVPLLVYFGYVLIFKSPVEGEKTFDFGVVSIQRPEATLEHTFQLRNATNEELQIVDYRTTCGCTTSDLPSEQIAPGEEFSIPVFLTLKGSIRQSSKIRLMFENGKVAVLQIAATGRYAQPMTAWPEELFVVEGDKEGTPIQLRIEWFKVSKPPKPTFTTPEHVRIDVGDWQRIRRGNHSMQKPDKWSTQLQVILDKTLTGDEVIVHIQGSPPFAIPIEQVDAHRKPILTDPNL